MAFRVRGTTLPDRENRTLVIDGDRLHVDDHSTVELVSDGGWILPGLVDAHTHPGSEKPNSEYSEANLRQHLIEHRDAGVLLVRAPGSVEHVPSWVDEDPDLPRIHSAGHWLAQPGTFFEGGGRKLPYDQLVAAAVEEATASGRWCKIIGDWHPDNPAVPTEVLAEVVVAVHAIGGRVAVHAMSEEACHNSVMAGVDSIEHGSHLDPGLLDRMAAQGTALVPTLTAAAGATDRMRVMERSEFVNWMLAGWEKVLPITRSAHEAGVIVLAGTDSVPFGKITTEIDWLRKAGLPTEVAVGAASWTARDWLGLTGRIADGALADLVIYDEDPLADPGVLAHPKRIILKGRVVA
ncbi:MAG TPA: amidohydrolase family protein [Pseudonocardiaceae bacterium]|jgi:imidazolonepropionase-like amidohydrolase|nr:amidohydrolase family protein [Pseudonocardiaceae bacterium]